MFYPSTSYIISNPLPYKEKRFGINESSSLPYLLDTNISSMPKAELNDTFLRHFDSLKKKNLQKFLVQLNSSSDCIVIPSNRNMPELQEAFKTIASILNRVYFREFNKMQEFLMDFIKSSENKWVFIACKGYKIKGDDKVVEAKVDDNSLDSSIYSYKGSVLLCDSVSEESLKSEVSLISDNEEELINDAADSIENRALLMEKKRNIKLENEKTMTYMDLKQMDDLGRVPHIMIGIMPHKLANPLTYFIERSKNPPIKPSKHKDRAKNLY